jgi:3-hydroxy-D-aspartate aldolase
MEIQHIPLGIGKHEIDTPVLLLDLDAMEDNLHFMQNFCRKNKVNLRPHIKSHKTPALAHKQIEAGAMGIACQKLEEAEVMAEAGLKDILVTYEMVTPQKIRRLVSLAKQANIIACVDNPKNVQDLSVAAQAEGADLDLLVEINVGHKRCGVEPGKPTLALVKEVVKAPGLKFRGLMGYAGYLMVEEDREKRRKGSLEATTKLVETRHLVEKEGIEVEICSAGGTGTFDFDGTFEGVTEIQPGSYLTMDCKYKKVVPEFQEALTVLTTVVSRGAPDRASVDAGLKCITPDYGFYGLPEVKGGEGFGWVSIHEEHGNLKLSDPVPDIKPGDTLELIPAHGCSTFSLHDILYGTRKGKLECVWSISARGCFR